MIISFKKILKAFLFCTFNLTSFGVGTIWFIVFKKLKYAVDDLKMFLLEFPLQESNWHNFL